MKTHLRPAFTRADLLVVCVLLVTVAGLVLPRLVHAQAAVGRVTSINNMKQLGLAAHLHHDASGCFPAGNDANNYSAFAYLLPFVEEDNLYRQIDFKKPMTDKANDKTRKVPLKLFLSPLDPVKAVKENVGATNYVFCAGSKAELTDNDGVFYQESKVTLDSIKDGTSQTIMIGETLKGDGAVKATDVKRQTVALKSSALKELKDDAGVQDFKDGKNISGDRCANWMDGRFLQGTFSANRVPNDAQPDVNCDGLGGLSALRSTDGNINLAFADGSVRTLKKKIDLKVWKALATRAGGEKIPADMLP